MIGPIQTNKARDVVALFDVIETVDRPSWRGRSPRRWPAWAAARPA